jgi:hypothetical protein
MISAEIIFGAISAVLAADTAFILYFLAHLSSKYQEGIVLRRKSLNEKLKEKINEQKTMPTTIEAFLPLFEEHEVIEDWKNALKQIPVNFAYSLFLAVIGLAICLLGYNVTINGVPVEVIFVLGGGLYLLMGVYSMIRHHRELGEWKISE